ncbi:MAG: rhomboid family intramembrane serine protease [Spiroplasma sp.]|nr:rhomboid family intramembrane serine protease [Spiroplasma sp.]
MEENILDVLGLQLVDYFINFEEYQPFNIPAKLRDEAKGKVYLVNKKSTKYQVIEIIKQNIANSNEVKVKDDAIFVALKKEFAFHDASFKVLVIVLNDEGQNEYRQSPTMDIIVATPNNVIKELAKNFPAITKAINAKVIEEYQAEKDDEDLETETPRAKNWKKVNFQNRRFLKDAILKSTNAHLVVTWLFFAIPVVCYILFTILMNTNAGAFQGGISQAVINLVFGASNRNLVFGANQYWRWITYPFVEFDSLSLILSLWMFYRIGRYIEGFYGSWKAVIIWLGAIVLTGVLQTTVDHINVLNGFMIISLISIGAMFPIIYNYKLFKTKIMSKVVSTFVLLMLFWMLFYGFNPVMLLYWMIAIGSGWLLGSLVSYHNRQLTVFYAFTPVAIGLLALFAVLVAFLNPYHHYDNNSLTYNTLLIYKQFNLIGQDFLSWVMSHYFGVVV